MSQITNQSICVIGIITAIVVIPRYLRLPPSLELLYHDKIGQLLLLVLAVVVGSYNFTCGVLLALLFLSIMLQTQNNYMNGTEGFEDYDMDEDADMKLNEDFDDVDMDEDVDTELNESFEDVVMDEDVDVELKEDFEDVVMDEDVDVDTELKESFEDVDNKKKKVISLQEIIIKTEKMNKMDKIKDKKKIKKASNDIMKDLIKFNDCKYNLTLNDINNYLNPAPLKRKKGKPYTEDEIKKIKDKKEKKVKNALAKEEKKKVRNELAKKNKTQTPSPPPPSLNSLSTSPQTSPPPTSSNSLRPSSNSLATSSNSLRPSSNSLSASSNSPQTSPPLPITDTFEGFSSCGGDDSSSSRNDERRVKLLKYQEATSEDDSLIEPFTNVRKNNNNFNPYDNVGCKFDVNYQPRNEFIYGPPLSSCDAYLNNNFKQIGTVFYPLN